MSSFSEQDQIADSLAMSVAVSDRDADVRSSQAGIVDAGRPLNPTTWPLPGERGMTPLLVGGREAGEQRGLLGRIGSSGSGIFSMSAPSSMGWPKVPRPCTLLRLIRSLSPVRNLNSDAMLVKGLDGRSAVFLGGSRNATVPFEHKVAFIILRAGQFARQFLSCHCQPRKASLLRLAYSSFSPDHQVGVIADSFPSSSNLRALLEDLLPGSLGERIALLRIFHEYGHQCAA